MSSGRSSRWGQWRGASSTRGSMCLRDDGTRGQSAIVAELDPSLHERVKSFARALRKFDRYGLCHAPSVTYGGTPHGHALALAGFQSPAGVSAAGEGTYGG